MVGCQYLRQVGSGLPGKGLYVGGSERVKTGAGSPEASRRGEAGDCRLKTKALPVRPHGS